ncbi:MAG: MAPEG family protein [Hyphomonadaceae bacterium]|nr:MAPEG family protein [Hyphomonadaceae bacterium]
MPALSAPLVSAVTAGVLIIIQMALILTVVVARRRGKQSLGDGGDANVLRATRRHGNFAENAAIFVVALALFEMLGGERLTAEIYAGIFIFGRLAHAIGLSLKNTRNLPRVLGILATVGVGVVLGVRLVMLGLPLLQAPS